MLNPDCTQNRSSCFAYRHGKCKALQDTKFVKNGKPYKCPFYKPRKIGDKR